jgi:hypothetical protein
MGVYYQAVCAERRELIDPDTVGLGCKYSSVISGEFANFLAFVMATRWLGANVALLGDAEPEALSDADGDFADVSAEEYSEFRSHAPELEGKVEHG